MNPLLGLAVAAGITVVSVPWAHRLRRHNRAVEQTSALQDAAFLASLEDDHIPLGQNRSTP